MQHEMCTAKGIFWLIFLCVLFVIVISEEISVHDKYCEYKNIEKFYECLKLGVTETTWTTFIKCSKEITMSSEPRGYQKFFCESLHEGTVRLWYACLMEILKASEINEFFKFSEKCLFE
uniref:Venom protein n=1 Tax=Tityus obscurus TaxID=1221240 RepID=A0A1E1WVK3_TITOB